MNTGDWVAFFYNAVTVQELLSYLAYTQKELLCNYIRLSLTLSRANAAQNILISTRSNIV